MLILQSLELENNKRWHQKSTLNQLKVTTIVVYNSAYSLSVTVVYISR